MEVPLKVGIAFDLIDHYLAQGFSWEEACEFDLPVTIDSIEEALMQHGCLVDRIGNVKDLAARLVQGDRWDIVFNVAEGVYGLGREAQIPALLDAWQIPYTFSDPLVCALTLDKALTKRILRDHGLPTPPFILVQDLSDLDKVDLPYPLMLKPLREGTSKGVSPDSVARTGDQLKKRCAYLLETFKQPVLIETYLSGREFTVGFLGSGEDTRLVGVLEKLLGDEPVYYKYAVGFPGVIVDDPEARRAGELALAAWKTLGCQDGGRVDVRSDANGTPYILEANPLPGLRPENSDLPVMCELAGIPYHEMISAILKSALSRLENGPRSLNRNVASSEEDTPAP